MRIRAPLGKYPCATEEDFDFSSIFAHATFVNNESALYHGRAIHVLQRDVCKNMSVATFGVLPMVKSANLPMVLLVLFLPMVTRKP